MNTVNLAMMVRNLSDIPIVLTYDPNWDDQELWINGKLNKTYTLNPNDRTTMFSPKFSIGDLTDPNLLGIIFSSDAHAESNFYQFVMGCTDEQVFGITDSSTTGEPKFKMKTKYGDAGSCIIELS
ncbi:MAG: hypothetical protein ACPGEE_01010 [Opitutales bacterium]